MKALLKILLLKPIYSLLILIVAIFPGHSLGWAIIIVTLIIRFALLPLTNKGTVAMKKMQLLQPEISALREKYKDDSSKQGIELMALYKRHGVNPVGSCLPTLVQLPVLLVLYYALRQTAGDVRIDLLYSFIPHPASVSTAFFGIDLLKKDLWILPILSGLLQFGASWQIQAKTNKTNKTNMPDGKTKSSQDDMMASLGKQMLYIFPIMTVLIGRSVPASLALYWVITMLFTVVQQQIVFSRSNMSVVHPTDEPTPVLAAGTPTLQEVERKMGKGGVEVVVRKKS